MQASQYEFLRRAGRILNSGQARTLVLTGEINDLFRLSGEKSDSTASEDRYVPLLQFLAAHWDLPDRILVVYELNGPIRFLHDSDRELVKDAWLKFRTGLDSNQIAIEHMLHAGRTEAELAAMSSVFDTNLNLAIGKPTLALELMRQMCLASRASIGGESLLAKNLIILVEAADMLVPDAEISRLTDADRHRVAICQDWFSDPDFTEGDDAVILLSESRSMLNHRISKLPQVLEVEVSSADEAARLRYIEWFDANREDGQKLQMPFSKAQLARLTAGLSIHALAQLLKGAGYENQTLCIDDVIARVERYIQSQLGSEIVEFKKPAHDLDEVIGNTRLKRFLRNELIPRFKSSGPDALPGAAVAGPIGGGKTFIFEALASELDMVVLVLKNIRSQWYGQTDVIFERLRRVLNALSKVLIFVDEADTQFGRVDVQAHATERRLTGKIQAMMSDPALRGKVIWLLMTARIHLLSADIRRPGRTGDLIIPVLDPDNEDRDQFIQWTIGKVLDGELTDSSLSTLRAILEEYSAAAFASLRSELIARASGKKLSLDDIIAVANDLIPPDIGKTRKYQTFQALVNCTRRSLLPTPDVGNRLREKWRAEIEKLEREGVQ